MKQVPQVFGAFNMSDLMDTRPLAQALPRQPLPQTVAEKIAYASTLKSEGNEYFKAGDLRKAAKSYKSVFLYLNGLHGAGSEMKGMFSAMTGSDNSWEGTDDGNKITGEGQEEEVKRIKVEASLNLSIVYYKMGDGEKSLKYSSSALQLDPNSPKAFYRQCQSLLLLCRYSTVLPMLESAYKSDSSNTGVGKMLREARERVKEEKRKEREKERQMFGGKF